MDASLSIFDPSPTSSERLQPMPPPRKDKETDPMVIDPNSIGVLEAIPDFKTLLTQVATDARTEGWSEFVGPKRIAYIDTGIVCSANIAGKVGLSVFRKVFEKLRGRSLIKEERTS